MNLGWWIIEVRGIYDGGHLDLGWWTTGFSVVDIGWWILEPASANRLLFVVLGRWIVDSSWVEYSIEADGIRPLDNCTY